MAEMKDVLQDWTHIAVLPCKAGPCWHGRSPLLASWALAGPYATSPHLGPSLRESCVGKSPPDG